MVGPIVVVLFVVFLCSGFRSPLRPLLYFIKVLIICVSRRYFINKVEDSYADQSHICNLVLHQSLGLGFARVKLV